MSSSAVKQGELWQELSVEHHWFHIVRALIIGGDMAKMGVNSWAAYCSIKSHTDLKSGESHATIGDVATDMGVSKPTAERAVKTLLELGYAERGRMRGRAGTFKIKEKIPMTLNGEVVALGERDYTPYGFSKFVEDLEKYGRSGTNPADKKISINLTVNLIQQGDNGTVNISNINVADGGFEENLSEKVREKTTELLRQLGRL